MLANCSLILSPNTKRKSLNNQKELGYCISSPSNNNINKTIYNKILIDNNAKKNFDLVEQQYDDYINSMR